MIHKFPDTDSQRIAVFAGSFNPFTVGHLSVLRRGLQLFDKIIVVLGYNIDKESDAIRINERRESLSALLAPLSQVEVWSWSGLTVDAARKAGARFLLRGVRTVADFEYERNMADINRELSGIETVVFFATPSESMVSSSMVRELSRYGHDVTRFLPPNPIV
ncbi:MAG: pantetheine-phosphate adenylyltransferase [Paramuribaculum sp.]|nr:pantetheine-phosphate adenylyltransferase [Paramuribaculum sp.]